MKRLELEHGDCKKHSSNPAEVDVITYRTERDNNDSGSEPEKDKERVKPILPQDKENPRQQ